MCRNISEFLKTGCENGQKLKSDAHLLPARFDLLFQKKSVNIAPIKKKTV